VYTDIGTRTAAERSQHNIIHHSLTHNIFKLAHCSLGEQSAPQVIIWPASKVTEEHDVLMKPSLESAHSWKKRRGKPAFKGIHRLNPNFWYSVLISGFEQLKTNQGSGRILTLISNEAYALYFSFTVTL
jgi:hypothetical protein